MPDQDRKQLIAEAADIFVRLRESPSEQALLAERDAFLERGKAEQDVYAHVAKAWAGASRKPGPNKALVLAVVASVAASLYLGAEPLGTRLSADVVTRFEMRDFELASGDAVVLDAGTALEDDTEGDERHVNLLRGAALFDVNADESAFVVTADGVEVEVTGTVFEVARLQDSVSVSVEEGSVRVRSGATVWNLGEGDHLVYSVDDGVGEIQQIEPTAVASWQQDRFVADGLTFEQVADVIDRRLPGRVIIGRSSLATSRVSGTISLANPEEALEALAATRGARLISVSPIGYLILP